MVAELLLNWRDRGTAADHSATSARIARAGDPMSERRGEMTPSDAVRRPACHQSSVDPRLRRAQHQRAGRAARLPDHPLDRIRRTGNQGGPRLQAEGSRRVAAARGLRRGVRLARPCRRRANAASRERAATPIAAHGCKPGRVAAAIQSPAVTCGSRARAPASAGRSAPAIGRFAGALGACGQAFAARPLRVSRAFRGDGSLKPSRS